MPQRVANSCLEFFQKSPLRLPCASVCLFACWCSANFFSFLLLWRDGQTLSLGFCGQKSSCECFQTATGDRLGRRRRGNDERAKVEREGARFALIGASFAQQCKRCAHLRAHQSRMARPTTCGGSAAAGEIEELAGCRRQDGLQRRREAAWPANQRGGIISTLIGARGRLSLSLFLWRAHSLASEQRGEEEAREEHLSARFNCPSGCEFGVSAGGTVQVGAEWPVWASARLAQNWSVLDSESEKWAELREKCRFYAVGFIGLPSHDRCVKFQISPPVRRINFGPFRPQTQGEQFVQLVGQI